MMALRGVCCWRYLSPKGASCKWGTGDRGFGLLTIGRSSYPVCSPHLSKALPVLTALGISHSIEGQNAGWPDELMHGKKKP